MPTVPSGVRVISFDVFDTLLTRAVADPHAVFLLLGRSLASSSDIACSPETFARLRTGAETRARSAAESSECTLREVYAELVGSIACGTKDIDRLMEAELELERRLIRPVPEAFEKVRDYRTSGCRVAFLSDMYLPSRFVREMLGQHQMIGADDIVLLSSEVKTNKSGGGMFRLLAERAHVPLQAILHIGDNEHSDAAVPRSLGVHVAPDTSASLTRYERIWESRRWENEGLSSLFAGASRLARLGTPAGSPRSSTIRHVSAGVVGPTLTAYVLWILLQARKRDLSRLYFVSRDGQILMEIAKRLAPKLGLDIEFRYLYGSRKVWQIAGLRAGDLATADWPVDGQHATSLDDVLGRLHLSRADVAEALEDCGIDPVATQDSRHPAQARAFRRLLAHPDAERLALARASTNRSLFVRYLVQEGVTDTQEVGVIDTGWSGRSQHFLARVLEDEGISPPQIFLFGHTVGRADAWDAPGVISSYLFDEHRHAGWTNAVPDLYFLMETFCAGDHGLLLGYEESGEVIRPVLQEEVNMIAESWGLKTLRETVYAFVDALTLDSDIAYVEADLRGAVVDTLSTFWLAPSPDEARAWGSFLYEDDPLALDRRLLARPFTRQDVRESIRARSLLNGDRVWKAGSIALSPPHIRRLVRAVAALRPRYQTLRWRARNILRR